MMPKKTEEGKIDTSETALPLQNAGNIRKKKNRERSSMSEDPVAKTEVAVLLRNGFGTKWQE